MHIHLPISPFHVEEAEFGLEAHAKTQVAGPPAQLPVVWQYGNAGDGRPPLPSHMYTPHLSLSHVDKDIGGVFS